MIRGSLGCYSDPLRDQRGHTVSAVYVAKATGSLRAADDAKNVQVFLLDDLPELAFDHELIMADYRRFREQAVVTPLRF